MNWWTIVSIQEIRCRNRGPAASADIWWIRRPLLPDASKSDEQISDMYMYVYPRAKTLPLDRRTTWVCLDDQCPPLNHISYDRMGSGTLLTPPLFSGLERLVLRARGWRWRRVELIAFYVSTGITFIKLNMLRFRKVGSYKLQHCKQYTHRSTGWLGSRVVSVLDSGAEGPGFKSQSRRCRVTVLGKLFTPTVPLFTKKQNW